MKPHAKFVFALAVLGCTFGLAPASIHAADRPKVGRLVSDFAFTDLAGREHHLSDFAGHYVLLDFWATWCAPCLKEFPTLEKAADKFQPRGLLIVGMNSDRDAAQARRFVLENHVPWTEASPESTRAAVARRLKVQWYPAMILLGPNRRILMVSGNGGKTFRGDKLLKVLDRLLPEAGASGVATLQN